MWFALSLLSGLLFAINKLIVRSALNKETNPLAFAALHEVIAGGLLLPFALPYITFPKTLDMWIALGIGVFGIFIADLFSFFALQHIEVSLYQILNQIRHIVILGGGYVLFTETITPIKLFSVICIAGGVFIALHHKTAKSVKIGIIYACISTLGIAFATLFIKKTASEINPIVLASLALLVSGMLTYITILIQPNHRHITFPRHNLKAITIAATIFALFEYILFSALAIGEASKVAPVSQSSLIFALIGGYIFLKERNNIQRKIIGSLLIALGIVLLYFT